MTQCLLFLLLVYLFVYSSLFPVVKIYKRAQILVADIWAAFDGMSFGFFDDIDEVREVLLLFSIVFSYVIVIFFLNFKLPRFRLQCLPIIAYRRAWRTSSASITLLSFSTCSTSIPPSLPPPFFVFTAFSFLKPID